MPRLIAILFFIGFSLSAYAQELLCTVRVQAPNVQGIDRTVFKQLEREVYQYMNQNQWTNDKFAQNEKIKCSLTIIITNVPSVDRFEGTMQIQVVRPVLNSSYQTVTLNFIDKNFAINYVPFQTMRFSVNTYVNNLTSILNFWAYMILGIDYDTFGKRSGLTYFQQAREVLNLAQANSPERGWNAVDGTYTRYWLMENFLNSSYQELHDVYYIYHRKGLDVMHKDVNGGREEILRSLKLLQKVFLSNPNIIVHNVFVDSKSNELITMFQDAFPAQRTEFIRIMKQLDPANANKYEKINKRD